MDKCGTESNVSTKAEQAGDLNCVGIDPGLWNLGERCHLLGLEQRIQATELLLDLLAAESEVGAEFPEAGNLSGVRSHPVDCHDEDDGQIAV
jgi:hypothetical protein